MTSVLLLHPGAMGVTAGASMARGGHRVSWVSGGRSPATAARAQGARLERVPTLGDGLARAEVVVSVCPPDAAAGVAAEVAAAGFTGLYVDANAVAPATAEAIGELLGAHNIGFVDGSITGPPAHRPGTTRLFLSGPAAGRVAELFAAGPMEAVVLDAGIGAASALKMCFAAVTKVNAALLLAVAATAGHHGVLAPLQAEWERRGAGTGAALGAAVTGSAPKAWRFVGEMTEIAATFAAAGLPAGFAAAAADVYRRLSGCKDAEEPPNLDEVIAALAAAARGTAVTPR